MKNDQDFTRPFDKEHVAALRDVLQIAGTAANSMLLIGAQGRFVSFDWRFGLESRTTLDIDLAIELKSWNDFGALAERLTEGHVPTFIKSNLEQRFFHRSGVTMDLVPYGQGISSKGELKWPKSGRVMSVLGFKEARDNAREVGIDETTRISVVTPPWFIVLKLLAWNDRKQLKDLEDIDFVLKNSLGKEFAEIEVFKQLADLIVSEKIDFGNEASAFLFGQQVAEKSPRDLIQAVRKILESLNDPYAEWVTQLAGRRASDKERGILIRRFQALALGLRETPL